MRFAAIALLPLIAAGLATGIAAQTPSAICKACLTKGYLVCARHGKALALEQAPFVLDCSVAQACKNCGGALATDCKQCSNPSVEAQLLERRRLAQQWLDAQRKIADVSVTKDPFLHLSTTHCELTFSLRPATIGRDKLDSHQRMHVYGERIEALRTMFLQVLEMPETDLPDRLRVFMFEDARDHGVIGPRETGLGTQNSVGLKEMGPDYVYSMWDDRRSLPDDDAVHRNILHNVTHLLLSQMAPAVWLGNRKHGWLDEGVAHWFEDRIGGKCTNFCFEELLLQSVASFKGGVWRPPVRRMVDEGKAQSFASLSTLNTDELTYEQHAMAFGFVDYFMAQGGAKFRDFLRLIKKGQATRDAMQSVYGWSPLTIDSQFQQWVKDNYSLQPPR